MDWDTLKNGLSSLSARKELRPDREILLAIMEKLDKIEEALSEKNVCLYADDKKIAESAGIGNRLLGRTTRAEK